MYTKTLFPWFGAIISKFISGLFHGSVIGGGASPIVDSIAGTAPTVHSLILATVIGAIISGIKDVAFYINANPMPNIFAQPEIAPVSAPVAPPTVGDSPKTLVSPSNQT